MDVNEGIECAVVTGSTKSNEQSQSERSQPLMSVEHTTCELGRRMTPVVSCDSIHFSTEPSNNPMARRNILQAPHNGETLWSLNHRKRNEITPILSTPRNRSSPEAYSTLRQQVRSETPRSEVVEKISPSSISSPPNVIVFINNAVKRQRRRSSMCSQITMDAAIKNTEGGGCDDIEEGDHSNASLDVQDIFLDTKKYNKANDESSVSFSSCSDSSGGLSYSKERLLLQKDKAKVIKTIVRKKKVCKIPANIRDQRSANSAMQRWMQVDTDDQTKSDDSQMSESEYEDYAKDSLAGNQSRNILIRRVASLRVIENEVADTTAATVASIPRKSCNTKEDKTATTKTSPNKISICGRAA